MNRLILSIFLVCFSALAASAKPLTANSIKTVQVGKLTCVDGSFLHQVTDSLVICLSGIPNQGYQKGKFIFGVFNSDGDGEPFYNPKLNLDDQTLYQCPAKSFLNTDITKNQMECYIPQRLE